MVRRSITMRLNQWLMAGGLAFRVDLALDSRLAIGCDPAFSGCFTVNGVFAFTAPLAHRRGSLLMGVGAIRG